MTAEELEDLDSAAADYSRGEVRRNEFVELALPFAHRLARRYRGRGEPADDLEQVARLGLVKSVERYDPERGSFTAYAIVTITGEIKRHFRDRTWGLHVPRRMQDLSVEVSHASAQLTTELYRRPTAREIAKHLSVDVREVHAAQASAAAHSPVSLNAPLDSESGAEVADLIGQLDRGLGLVDDRSTLAELLTRVPARERRILALRFSGDLSQTVIAEQLGISQMHVSRLLNRTLAWLREAMLSDVPPVWPGDSDLDHRLKMVITRRGDIVRVAVSGELDRDNSAHLREELMRHLTGGRLEIDLHGTPMLDASAISVLLAVEEAGRVRDIRVRVVGLSDFAARLAERSGLTR